MSLYSKFCAWLSGWPESSLPKSGRTDTDEDMMFAEEEQMIRENNKNIGKKHNEKESRKTKK
jgi:hypothetical protein